MDLLEAIQQRHSVRNYLDKPIEGNTLQALNTEIEKCNKESGLRIKLAIEDGQSVAAFAHYGSFSGVTSYIAILGDKCNGFEQKCGYYGQRLALFAQTLGLNTCWVAMSYSKSVAVSALGEKPYLVLTVGYGKTQGVPHRSKPLEKFANLSGAPDWFVKGVEGAALAPTAMNQQKFSFTLDGNKVKAKSGIGFYVKADLGIAKYNFELCAGKDNFVWAD